jgi:hypothetical protein
MSAIGVPEIVALVVILAMFMVIIYPAARVCRRMGFSPWLGVLAVVPLANLVLLWFVAMTDWPSSKTSA